MSKVIITSKIFWLWPIAVLCACIGVPLIQRDTPGISYVLTSMIIVYIIAAITLKYFAFYEEFFIRRYPLLFWTNQIKYSDLHYVEIRNLRAPYQQPYVIFHFNPKRSGSLLFEHRSFVYNKKFNLDLFIEFMRKKNVRIEINIDA